jgi:hypothetical protein
MFLSELVHILLVLSSLFYRSVVVSCLFHGVDVWRGCFAERLSSIAKKSRSFQTVLLISYISWDSKFCHRIWSLGLKAIFEGYLCVGLRVAYATFHMSFLRVLQVAVTRRGSRAPTTVLSERLLVWEVSGPHPRYKVHKSTGWICELSIVARSRGKQL